MEEYSKKKRKNKNPTLYWKPKKKCFKRITHISYLSEEVCSTLTPPPVFDSKAATLESLRVVQFVWPGKQLPLGGYETCCSPLRVNGHHVKHGDWPHLFSNDVNASWQPPRPPLTACMMNHRHRVNCKYYLSHRWRTITCLWAPLDMWTLMWLQPIFFPHWRSGCPPARAPEQTDSVHVLSGLRCGGH